MISAFYIRHFSLPAAAALLPAALLIAQMPGGGAAPPSPGQQPSQQAPANPAATANLPEQTSQQDMVDQSFVWNTMENDRDQIQLSQLAEQKSPSSDVKQFGEQMVKIHSELDGQLQPAARQLNEGVPKGPSKKEKKEIDKLQALSGPEFDGAYLEAMGRAQRASLKQFKDEAKSSQNAALRQAASQDEPLLAQHYQILEKIAQAHNVDLEAREKK